MQNIAYQITKNSITVAFDGQTHTVLSSDQTLYQSLLQGIKAGDEQKIKRSVSRAAVIKNNSKGVFDVVGDTIMVDGQPVNGILGETILSFIDEGIPFEPLVKFCRKLRNNPSKASVDQLFAFLEANRHPITVDGNFIAYKKVRPDMKDIHSGTFDNSVGKTLEMPREAVNPDPTQTCSTGLHVASWDYASNSFGSAHDTLVEVEVDPADVVAVPIDYNQGKMRTCRYKVRAIVTNPNKSTTIADADMVKLAPPQTGELLVEQSEEESPQTQDKCPSCDEEDCDRDCYDDEECPDCGELYCDCDCYEDDENDE
jgi:hypothetical protein